MLIQELKNAEPRTYEEAVNSIDMLKWLRAMRLEIDSLEKNGTWSLVRKPEK